MDIKETSKEKENKQRGLNTLIIYAEFDTYTKKIERIYLHLNDLAAAREWENTKKTRQKMGMVTEGIILLRIGELDTENMKDDIIIRGTKVKKVLEAEAWKELKNYETEDNKI